jgi:cell division protein FtsB
MIFSENIDEPDSQCFFIAMNFTQFTSPQNIFHKTAGKLRISILASILLFSFSQLSAKEDTASQLQAIEKRLAALEQENAKLKERISELEKGGAQEIAKQIPGLIPQDETEKKAFFDKFRREFKSSQDQARGPWDQPRSMDQDSQTHV